MACPLFRIQVLILSLMLFVSRNQFSAVKCFQCSLISLLKASTFVKDLPANLFLIAPHIFSIGFKSGNRLAIQEPLYHFLYNSPRWYLRNVCYHYLIAKSICLELTFSFLFYCCLEFRCIFLESIFPSKNWSLTVPIDQNAPQTFTHLTLPG